MPQASLIKGRFGGIIYIVENSNGEAVEPIPNKKAQTEGRAINHYLIGSTSDLFIEDYRRVIQCIEYIRLRSNARQRLATSPPLSKGDLGGM